MELGSIDSLRSLSKRLGVPARVRRYARGAFLSLLRLIAPLLTYARLRARRHMPSRRLEIGPGCIRIPGFETLNIRATLHTDYVLDAGKRLPFADGTFELIHASHVLEHIPWYHAEAALREWARILKPGGGLEIWVPDGLKICSTLVRGESEDVRTAELDGWDKLGNHDDPCKWAASRLYTYGDGSGRWDHPNWHRAVFTERYLHRLLRQTGLTSTRTMGGHEARGHSHGWISLGVCGQRPC